MEGAVSWVSAGLGADVDLAPTPRDVVFSEGTARVLRFRGERAPSGVPLLLVPSMINRWYVLDLRRGASLVEHLVAEGIDTFCLDWGVPNDEDRHLDWDGVVARLSRALRVVRRTTGAERVALLGYCMGGTLAAIEAALRPESIACLVNLAGPIDFTQAGQLAYLVDPRWFDVDAITAAGNVSAEQMQSGFSALRPTLAISKWVGLVDRAHTPGALESFTALERWSSDNVPFPAAAYATYIRELYQQNALVAGEHRVAGRRVDLHSIACPTLVVAADGDTICPLPAARALASSVGTEDTDVAVVPGGHVGAVVGSRARAHLYPRIARFVKEKSRWI